MKNYFPQIIQTRLGFKNKMNAVDKADIEFKWNIFVSRFNYFYLQIAHFFFTWPGLLQSSPFRVRPQKSNRIFSVKPYNIFGLKFAWLKSK